MDKAISAISIRLNLTRLQLLLSLLVLVLIIAGIVFYRMDYFSKVYAYAFRSNLTVTVTDTESKEALPATIILTNTKRVKYVETETADASGQAKFSHLVRGNYNVIVTYKGYDKLATTTKLSKRNGTVANFTLKKTPPEESVVSGTVQNYINELGLSNITVTIGDLTAKSDSNGKFTIPKVITGEKEIIIKQTGYLDYSKKVTVTGKQFAVDSIALVPVGKVVYISNKDQGRRGIYTSNYDGSDVKFLVERVADHEDFSPSVSPDFKKVAFLSTRDGQKDGSTELYSLYVVDIDGKNLTKIGDRAEYSNYWSTNSKYIVWTGTVKENDQTTYNDSIYNVSAKSNKLVVSSSMPTSLSLNVGNTKLAYVYNNQLAGQYELNIYDIGSATISKLYQNNLSFYIVKFNSDSELVYGMYQNNQQKYFAFNLGDNTSKETDYQYPKRNTVKSPDGKKETYIEMRDGKTNLFVADDSLGKNEKQLSSVDAAAGSPYWSTDSKLIFFNVQKTGESALYVVSVDGGTAKKIIDVASDGYGGYGY
jgi:Tol biopolymer transport system component